MMSRIYIDELKFNLRSFGYEICSIQNFMFTRIVRVNDPLRICSNSFGINFCDLGYLKMASYI